MLGESKSFTLKIGNKRQMGKFKYMPDDICPDDSEHIDYKEVYRAVKSTDKLAVSDFLPWNVEHHNSKKTFKNLFKKPEYGLSVFTTLSDLKETVEKYPALDDSTKAYAKGYTTIKRGISTKESQNHHVEYFLYDYLNNSPKDDFFILEVRGQDE